MTEDTARHRRPLGRRAGPAGPRDILIVDDSEMNRAILAEILGSDYNILEASTGRNV